MTFATIGTDLQLQGAQQAIGAPNATGAVNIGVGSYYRCTHNIPASGGSYANQFTIMMEVCIAQTGRWYSLYQTNVQNANDAD